MTNDFSNDIFESRNVKGGICVIEFDGYLTGTAEKHFFNRTKILTKNKVFAILLLVLPAIIVFSFYFNLHILFKIYVVIVMVLSSFLMIPRSKKTKKEIVPKRIYVDGESLVCISDKNAESRLVSDVKRVTDFGEFYEIAFPFGKISANFICQKNLLSKGSLEDFETLFDGEIVSPIKKNLKNVYIVIAFLLCVAVFCVAMSLWSDSQHIEDTNGMDNYTLETITDAELISLNTSSTADSVEHGTYGNKSGVNQNSVADYDIIKYSSERTSGIKVMQATKVSKDTLILTIDNVVESGNCKIVIVIDGEIYTEIQLNSQNTIELKDMQGKEVFVVIGCESAKLDFEISRTQEDRS